MKKLETDNWEAFALFSEALKRIESYKSNRQFAELEDAKKKLESALIHDPSFTRALYHLAILYDLIGRHEDAVDNLLKLLKTEYRLEAIYALGAAYFHQYTYKLEAYEKAIQYFKLLLKEVKKYPKEKFKNQTLEMLSHAGLANIYAHLTIKSPGVKVEVHKRIAEKYFKLTIKEYKIVLKRLDDLKNKVKPEILKDINWLILNAYGVALMYRGKGENNKLHVHKAIDKFNNAMKFSINTNILSNLGTACMFLHDILKKRNPMQAMEYLEKAYTYFKVNVLDMRPKYDFAFYRLASICRKKGDFKKANNYIRLAEENRSEISEAVIKMEKQKILRHNQD